MPNKPEQITKAVEELKELNEIKQLAEQIKNNKIQFSYKEIVYRVRPTNFREEEDIRKERNRKFIELLNEEGMELRENLIKIYKKSGVDIDDIDVKIKAINRAIEKTQKQLAPIDNDNIAKTLETEIENLLNNLQDLAIKKSELLEFCLENELINHMNNYLVYLVLEKEIINENKETKFERVFGSYEDFMNCEDKKLLMRAINNLSLILREEYSNE